MSSKSFRRRYGRNVEQVESGANDRMEKLLLRQARKISGLGKRWQPGGDYGPEVMELLRRPCALCGKPALWFAGSEGFCRKHKREAKEANKAWRAGQHPMVSQDTGGYYTGKRS